MRRRRALRSAVLSVRSHVPRRSQILQRLHAGTSRHQRPTLGDSSTTLVVPSLTTFAATSRAKVENRSPPTSLCPGIGLGKPIRRCYSSSTETIAEATAEAPAREEYSNGHIGDGKLILQGAGLPAKNNESRVRTGHGGSVPEDVDTTRIGSEARKTHLRKGIRWALSKRMSIVLIDRILELGQEPDFRYALTSATVAEICRCLNIEALAQPYKSGHDSVGRLHRLRSTMKHVEVFHDRMAKCIGVLMTMMEYWRSTTHRKVFGLKEYNSLLAAANELGDPELSQNVFARLRANAVSPDVISYNLYLESLCFNYYPPLPRLLGLDRSAGKDRSDIGLPGVFGSHLKENRAADEAATLPLEFARKGAYGTISERRARSLLLLKTFRQMTAEGIAPDTHTYCFVLLSLGRHGDLDEVKAILMQIWDVDVDSVIREESQASSLSTRTMPRSSSTYPKPILLYAIAHILAYHLDPMVAWRIVQHMSQKYRVPIDYRTWTELLRKALAFDIRAKASASLNPQVPSGSSAVDFLWQRMRSGPPAGKPNLTMYRVYLTSLFERGQHGRLYETLRQARWLVDANVKRFMTAGPESQRPNHFEKTLAEGRERAQRGLPPRRVDMLRSAHLHQRRYITQWLLLLLDPQQWPARTSFIRQPDFSVELVPTLLESFDYYQPQAGLQYRVATGMVHFNTAWRMSRGPSRWTSIKRRDDSFQTVQLTPAPRRKDSAATSSHD